MNLSAKCNCCVCEPVCKYKKLYKRGIEVILDAIIHAEKSESEAFSFWKVKDCPHIEVNIKCPHMITKGGESDA